MRDRILLLSLLCFAIAFSANAEKLSLDPISPPNPVIYDPFSGNDTIGQSFTFTVRMDKSTGTTSNFSVVINGESSPSSRSLKSSSGSIEIGFYKDSSHTTEIRSTADYSPSYYISGSFDPKTDVLTQTFTIYPRLVKGQSAPYGTYTETFTLVLYKKSTPGQSSPEDTLSFTYTAEVGKAVDVRVGPPNASYDTGMNSYNIDLGEISKGASANFGIFIKGTTGYTLTMHTASGGFLTSSNSSDKIQYTIVVDGKEYYLNSSVILDRETVDSLYSKALLGTIKIAADQNAEPGIYSDAVSFSVTVN